MIHALLILDEGGYFRQYLSIRSLCQQLSIMAGVSLRGDTYKLGFLIPFEHGGPDLFAIAELETWFKDNLRGPDFARIPSNPDGTRSKDGWWAIDKKVQKEWRINAEKELRKIIGHIID